MNISFHSKKSDSFIECYLTKNDGEYELEIDGYVISFPYHCDDLPSVIEHLTILFEAFESGLTIIENKSEKF